MHPDCTCLCVSGNGTYAAGKPKHQMRIDAAAWTEKLWDACIEICDHVCFENPVSVLPTLTHMPKPVFIQPHQHGHDASKATGLYLYGLEAPTPTKIIKGRIVTWNGKEVERWANQ